MDQQAEFVQSSTSGIGVREHPQLVVFEPATAPDAFESADFGAIIRYFKVESERVLKIGIVRHWQVVLRKSPY